MLYEFSLRYPNVSENAFDNAWKKLSMRAVGVFESYYQTKFNSSWSKEISHLLVLLKMFPVKASGKKLSLIESSYKKAEKKLIVFREVVLLTDINFDLRKNNYFLLQRNCPLTAWNEKENKFPYIAAFGDTKYKVTHFYIEAEREFMNVI